MAKINNFTEFLNEKPVTYKKATLIKYRRMHENGQQIPFLAENLIKTQILSEDNIDETENAKSRKESSDEFLDGAETTASYTDKDGKLIEVKEVDGSGMAGEPMTFAYVYHDGKISSCEKVKPFMKSSDYKDLEEYINNVSDNNQASAISWVI